MILGFCFGKHLILQLLNTQRSPASSSFSADGGTQWVLEGLVFLFKLNKQLSGKGCEQLHSDLKNTVKQNM